ncbi:unnamed protein product [Amoebophrya sp. A25]|nr:unnamed protein product [Amoebophrya sp. A25]|eukprot:GSA25T00021997001.1
MSIKQRIGYYDDLSLSAVSYLEGHEGVSEITLQGPVESPLGDVQKWEEEHAPIKLPDDYKDFLRITNGFYLKWSALIRGKAVPYGCMYLNGIEQVKLAAIEGAELNQKTKYFDLDSKCVGGRVALKYTPMKNPPGPGKGAHYLPPSVWFQDVSGTWFFIASSFTDYYRLMITHLGIPRWQYAYTDVGLDVLTKFWFMFLSPERLKIDDSRDHATALDDARRRSCKIARKTKLARKKKHRSSMRKKANQQTAGVESGGAGTESDSAAGGRRSRSANRGSMRLRCGDDDNAGYTSSDREAATATRDPKQREQRQNLEALYGQNSSLGYVPSNYGGGESAGPGSPKKANPIRSGASPGSKLAANRPARPGKPSKPKAEKSQFSSDDDYESDDSDDDDESQIDN